MVDWQVDASVHYSAGVFTYTEGSNSADCEYELCAEDTVAIISCSPKWDLLYPWAAGRQSEILNRVADRFLQDGDPAWRKSVDPMRLNSVLIKKHREIITVDAARTGVVEYREGPRSLTFNVRKGEGRLLATVVGPTGAAWTPFRAEAPARRHEIVARVADEVIRRLYPNSIPHYDQSRPNEMQIWMPSSFSPRIAK